MRVLYGKRAARDLADDLIRFVRPDPQPRWMRRDQIETVLSRLSATKTGPRLQLMHWTGMRPSQMGRLARTDFRLDDTIPFVVVPRGKFGRVATVPLVPEGLAAARAFIAADAFGPWSCPSANKILTRECERAGVPRFTVYAIRHSFAAGLRHTGADLADVQDLYGHTDASTTAIYAPPHLEKHLAAIERLRRNGQG